MGVAYAKPVIDIAVSGQRGESVLDITRRLGLAGCPSDATDAEAVVYFADFSAQQDGVADFATAIAAAEAAQAAAEAAAATAATDAVSEVQSQLNDEVAAAQAAAATAAADAVAAVQTELNDEVSAAQAAASTAAGYADAAVSQGNVPIYGMFGGVSALTIPNGISTFFTHGHTYSDVGGAKYRASDATETADYPASSWTTSNSGAKYWLLSEDQDIYADMFGARGNWDGTTGDDNADPLNDAIAYMSQRGGGVVYLRDSGQYYTTETITATNKVFVMGKSPASGGASFAASIVGALALSPVCEISHPSSSRACGFRNLGIMRESGTIPADSVGLLWGDADRATCSDLFICRHAIGIEVDNTALGETLERVYFGQIEQTMILWKNGPQLTLIDCSLGRNGGFDDADIDAYITIDTTAGGKCDTFSAIRTQFNMSGDGHAGSLLSFIHYTDSDGLFEFTNCHAERFNATTGVVITSDANSTVIRNLTFDATCSVLTSNSLNFFGTNAATQVLEFGWHGKTSFNMNLPGVSGSKHIVCGWLEGNVSCTGASQVYINAAITGNCTLSGTIGRLFVAGLIDGTFSDTSTGGDKVIQLGRAGIAGTPIPQTARRLFISSTPRTASLGISSRDHACQLSGIDGSTSGDLVGRWSANGSGPLREFFKSRNATIGSFTAVQSGDVLGFMPFSGDDGSAAVEGARIEAAVDGTVSSGRVDTTFNFYTRDSGGLQKSLVVGAKGNVLVGRASLSTSATDGFPYFPTCAGTPTGTPTAKTGFAPLVIDSTNNKLYAYIGGAWLAMN